MPTRRAFLLGGTAALAGLATGGALGAQTPLGRKALHAAGLLDSPDRTPPAGSNVPVERLTLPSGRRALVARTGAARPSLGLVCLHGRNDDERFAFDTLGIHRFAAAAGHNMVIASVDGGPSSYWHPRKDGRNPDPADLLALLDERAPGAPRAVIGWSMGGFGALLAAARRPDVFAKAVAASPAVFRRFADATPGAFDDAADFTRHDVLAAAPAIRARVRVDCGADDPFADVSDELRERIPGAVGRITPGFHDAAYWRWALPAQLAFLAG